MAETTPSADWPRRACASLCMYHDCLPDLASFPISQTVASASRRSNASRSGQSDDAAWGWSPAPRITTLEILSSACWLDRRRTSCRSHDELASTGAVSANALTLKLAHLLQQLAILQAQASCLAAGACELLREDGRDRAQTLQAIDELLPIPLLNYAGGHCPSFLAYTWT
jgi:hypothetical protein